MSNENQVSESTDEIERSNPIVEWLEGLKEPCRFTVLVHDDPDIDAMASMIGMCDLLRKLGHQAGACYAGQMAHTQNRIFSNKFDVPAKSFRLLVRDGHEDTEVDSKLSGTKIVVLDTSCLLGTGNLTDAGRSLSENTIVSAVIDHHAKVDQSDECVYYRSKVGACSTMIYELFSMMSIETGRDTATALLLGIEADTDGLRADSTCQRDRDAADRLRDLFDPKIYMDVMNYPKPKLLMDLKERAYGSRVTDDSVVVAGVGFIEKAHRSLMATIADEMMNFDGIQHACVIGIAESSSQYFLAISYRTSSHVVDADELVKMVFGDRFGARKGAGGGMDVVGDVLQMVFDQTDEEGRQSVFSRIVSAYARKLIACKMKLS